MNFNTTNRAAKSGLTRVPVSFQHREGSHVTEVSEHRSWTRLPGKAFSKASPPSPGATRLDVAHAWLLSVKWLQDRALHIRRRLSSLEKHNQRQPRCLEKAGATEKALLKEQVGQQDPGKGSRHPQQCWGHAPAWLGSPCLCPWDKQLGADKPVSI